MPVKTKAVKSKGASSPPCAICSSEVVLGTDNPVTCTACKRTAHRYCAGVSVEEYSTITADSPYICLTCFKEQYVATVAELREYISALKSEISELRSAMNDTQATTAEEEPLLKRNNGGQRSYAAATSSAIVSSDHAEMTTGKNKPRSGRAGKNVRTGWKTVQARPNTGARSNGAPGDTLTSSPSPSPNTKQSQRARVKIPNARKIWGTMRSCSAVTVANTIAQLCPTFIGKLQVRRKYKTSSSGKSRWWFVVHGEAEVLADLERNWEPVTLQTSWKLQDCLKYNDETAECSDGTPRSPMSDHDNAGSDPVCQPNPTVTIATPAPANPQQSVSQHVPIAKHSGHPLAQGPQGEPPAD